MPVATLPDDEVHLHFARPETIEDPAVLAQLRALLSEDELARCARFRLRALQHAGLITRALVRTTLAHYADLPAEAWRFRAGTHGRPEIDGDAHGLCFNVAHTEGLVVCAVARERPLFALGVDVEHVSVRAEPVAMAEQFFAPQEIAALRSLSGDALHERFLAIWTLKEAYAKARALGLHLPLERYAFTFDDAGRAQLWVDDGVRDHDAPWQFERLAIGPHRLAIAVRLSAGETPLRIRTFDGVFGAKPA